MTRASERVTGVVVASTAAGLGLGIADAVDTFAGGFTAGAGAVELIAAAVVAALAVGLVGAVAGALAAAAWAAGSRLGVARAPLVTAAVAIAVAALFAMSLWVLYGSGTSNRLGALVVGGGAVAGFAALALGLRRSPPAVHAVLWMAAIAGLYLLETRLIYMFSRRSPFAPVHVAGLLLLAGLAGVGVWQASEPLRGAVARRPRRARAFVAAALVVGIAGSVAMERWGSNAARLVLHERMSLAFRPLSLAPGARAGAVREWLGRDCAAAPAPAPAGATGDAPAPAAPVRGVVLVLIDTLRGDRLRAHRNNKPLMPDLLGLANRAVVFDNAYTPVPGTLRALTALFSDELASALRGAGVRTAAIAGHANLARFRSMFDSFDDGAAIERYDEHKNALTSEDIARRAVARLDELAGAGRFLLVVHFFDPHAHYVANPAFDFGRGEAARYDAEVAWTDRWLRGIAERVVAADDLALVVASDHGDELWEHRYKRHQLRLYDESTRVPIVVRAPGGARGVSIPTEVSLIDVAPTILELLGVPAAKVPGRSLLPAVVSGAPPPSRPVVSRSTDATRWSAVQRRRKLIFNRDSGILEYYNLEIDPGERRNLADSSTAAMKPLACTVDRHMKERGL